MTEIKEVFDDHAAVLAHLIREANKPIAEMFNINRDNNPKHPSFCEAEWIIADLERGERYFLLSKNQEPMACVAYEIPSRSDGTKKAYLNRLSVLPEQQNKGLGSKLVKHIFTLAKSDQLDFISIGVIADHVQLQSWYKKLGFVKKETKHFTHLPFDVLLMSYELDRYYLSI